MAEDRVAVLEERLAWLERLVEALRNALNASGRAPYVSANPSDPLDGHPLIAKKPPREQWAALEAQRMKELGLEDVEPMGAVKLRQMLIENGLDPNGTEFSRGIIEMREE